MDPKAGSKRKHQSLSIQEKVEMLKKVDVGVSVRKLCETYGIGSSTVYDIKKQREKILKFYEDSDSKIQMRVRKTMKDGKSTEHDRKMMDWVRSWRGGGGGGEEEDEDGMVELTGNLIKEHAKMLHQELKLEHRCDYSEGWLQRFKKRHGIVLQKNGGEKRSANPEEEEVEKISPGNVNGFNGGHQNSDQVCSGELAGEGALYGRGGPQKTSTLTMTEDQEEEPDPTKSETTKVRGDAIQSKKCSNIAGTHCSKPLMKGKCKLKTANKDKAGDIHEQKQDGWSSNDCDNDEAATPVCLYRHTTDYEIMETFPKSGDKKSNKDVYCESVENEEIGEEEEDENLSIDDLIELLGDLIKGLGQRTFVTEEELMNFYLMYEKLHREKSKRLEKLRIHEMFKKMTRGLLSRRLTGPSAETPVPSTSATKGDPRPEMSETQDKETIN